MTNLEERERKRLRLDCDRLKFMKIVFQNEVRNAFLIHNFVRIVLAVDAM